MKITIDQALQMAIEAHKAGKLNDAEILYRAIVHGHPRHPDANHNLGLIAVSLKKTKAALPLFQIALEANPNQGQFWLSYLDALIRDKQYENARVVLEQGKKRGLAGEKLELFEDKLSSLNYHSTLTQERKKVSTKKENKKIILRNVKNQPQNINPSQIELNSLLEHYKNKRYEHAQILAISLTQDYPSHPFGWKVLGALFEQTGKLKDAVISNQKALEIDPDDTQVHYNLGIVFKELGRLDDAEKSYKNAIALKLDFAEAHYNLGITLQDLGRLDDADASYKNAIAIRPDYAEAHCNLGNTLKELGKLEDAETSYKKAIAIKPNYAESHYNLGVTLQDLGRLKDAEASYRKAIAIKPNYAESHYNLGVTLQDLGSLEGAGESYKKAISIRPDYAQAYINLGATLKELGRLAEAEKSYKRAISLKPNLAQLYSNLGGTLKELGRYEDAEKSYKKAISLKPDFAEAHYNLGITLKDLGRLDEAQLSHLQAIRFKPEFIQARTEMLTCLYAADKKSQFFVELDYFIKENKPSSTIGSLTCRSALRYGEEKRNIFCNEPLKYALLVDLKSRYNFEDFFVQNVKSILSENKRSNRKQTLLSNGYQTAGNLFDMDNNFTYEIQKTVRLEIERYRINFEGSQEGFIKKWPIEYSLNGWLIVMKSGGELQPHIHENGWLSGSIYINVPPKKKIDSGSLVVALGKDSEATDSRQNSKKIIDVVTGSMALFPASLMHHTIPFESEEERIVLAFDVIPKS